jgi:hypothetical protein
MKYLALSLVILLSACSTVVPVKQKFPEAPQKLMTKCPQLKTIEGDKVTITDMLKVVVENYSAYYQCAVITDSWQEWYQIQKMISEQAAK